MRLDTLVHSTPAPADAAHPRNTEASLLVRRDGSYLLAYTEFCGSGRDDAAASIIGLVSRDGGQSWGERRTLQENTGGCNVMSPSLRRLDDGSILLAFIRKDSHTSCTLFSRRSEDDGERFGDPVQINSWEAYMGFVNDSLVQLNCDRVRGRIICPVYYSKGSCWSETEHYVARMCLSDDGGRSWRAAEQEVDCPRRGAMEPVVVEDEDGALTMLIRTQMGFVYRSRSSDGGDTWTAAEASPLTGQEAPIAARVIPGSERVLLVWNAAFDSEGASHGGRRSPLHVAVASPDLTAAPVAVPLVASDTATFSYPSICFDGDRVLLTHYVGQDQALIGGGDTTLLRLDFRALELPSLLS